MYLIWVYMNYRDVSANISRLRKEDAILAETVAEACNHLESLGVKGVGQSSWGPTGFAFVDSETQAHLMLRKLQSKFEE